jgi:hypothetical protein
LHSKIGDNGRVYFSGLINKNVGKVISCYYGRLNQQYKQHLQYDDENIGATNVGDVNEP